MSCKNGSGEAMIDWIAFLLAVGTLALCLFLVWRFVGRKARSRFVFAARLLLCLVLAVPIVGLGAWRFCNSRSMQVVGQIVNRVETTEPVVVAVLFKEVPVGALAAQGTDSWPTVEISEPLVDRLRALAMIRRPSIR